MDRAADIILKKGKFYLNGKYLSLQVWSKSITEMDALKCTYGGNYYPHGTGYVWILSRKSLVQKVVDDLIPLREQRTEGARN